jgi:hypothetical protein
MKGIAESQNINSCLEEGGKKHHQRDGTHKQNNKLEGE